MKSWVLVVSSLPLANAGLKGVIGAVRGRTAYVRRPRPLVTVPAIRLSPLQASGSVPLPLRLCATAFSVVARLYAWAIQFPLPRGLPFALFSSIARAIRGRPETLNWGDCVGLPSHSITKLL